MGSIAMGSGAPSAFAAPPAPAAKQAPASPQLLQAREVRKQGLKLAGERKYAEAIPVFERALALFEKAAGPSHLETANVVHDLGLSAVLTGDFKRAEALFLRVIAIVEQRLGKDHENLAGILASLAETYAAQKDFAKAVAPAERRLFVLEKVLNRDHNEVIDALISLIDIHKGARDWKRAIPLMERLVAYEEKSLGPTDVRITGRLFELSGMLHAVGEIDRAISLGERVVALLEAANGPDDINLAGALAILGKMYRSGGALEKAITTLERALAIRERKLEAGHADIIESLVSLSSAYAYAGAWGRAIELQERALAIREKALGAGHTEVADSLNDLAVFCIEQGRYEKALAHLRRSLAIREKALGPKDATVGTVLTNLGEALLRLGDVAGAEAQFARALTIVEEIHGPASLQAGTLQNNIAAAFLYRGDFKRALPAFQRSLAIREKVLGSTHRDVAGALGNVAEVHMRTGNAAAAIPLLERALSIREQALGVAHPDVALSLLNLASAHLELGALDKAEPMFERVLAIQEKSLGAGHPTVAVTLNNIAMLRSDRGDPKGAQVLLERTLKIQEVALGGQHPSLVVTLDNLAAQRLMQSDMAGALAAETRANAIAERYLALMITTGSEDQKLAYLDTLRALTDMTVSLHINHGPKDPAAAELALTTILQRKGRVLDAMAGSMNSLRERLAPEDRALLERLSVVRKDLARAVLAGPGKDDPKKQRAEIDALEREAERLEAAISAKSSAFRAQERPVTLKDVQAALPDGAALVELFVYRPWRPDPAQPFGAPRYSALVLPRSGPPSSVDLGDVTAIDAQVQALRAALSDPGRSDETRLARALDDVVMRPVRARLGEVRKVFLSPDGALNLVPFAALVDEQGRRLVERLSFTYLTSGRDLLRFTIKSPSRQPAAIVANPTFGERNTKDANGAGGASSGGDRGGGIFARANFTPLPATADEAKALGAILGGSSVMTGEQATKAALNKLAGPRILHIATHGFFLADPQPSRGVTASTRALELDPTSPASTKPRMPLEKPLLLSGLALAGANATGGAGADGILTALEAMGLDLQGTKLVVLSACETGVGEVRSGDGVYGLRRALVIAGAETQVMSLWKVDDEATRELMVSYYKRLEAGEGRSAAIADVQRSMMASAATAHPFFWASFIVSGDPSSLNGDRAPAAVPKVNPGARGCGCEVPGGPPGSDLAWIWLGFGAAIMVLGRARLRRS